jgi:hypothetical protein
MKVLSVVLFLLTSWVFPSSDESYLIICGKQITVDGNTTIGSFSCQYSESKQNDTLFLSKERRAKQPYAFSLNVPQFSCGNFLLNKDFQKTLQAAEHPQIVVEVTNLHPDNKGAYIGSVKLKLVGKSKIINDIRFFENIINGQKVLSTDFVFTASEFNLSPPKRLGGLVEADDCMKISVNLRLS